MRGAAVCLFVLIGCKADQTNLPAERARAAAHVTASTAPPLRCADLGDCVAACPSPATEACAAACALRLTAAALPYYDAMQACVVPACAAPRDEGAPCHQPGSFSCKMCVLKSCAALASACMSH